MATCEFEEKEFEAPLYLQLGTVGNHIWSPGQVFENIVGFDQAILCHNALFWALHGIHTPLPGVVLHGLHSLSTIARPLPNFALNLFLQAKRPRGLTRVPTALKPHGIVSPYWKFEITKHQQDRLEHLSSVLGPDALVCYAAPVFHRLTQLYAHTSSGTIVENSTFPRADLLHSHDAWNYSIPGAVGVANARPTPISQPGIEEQVASLFSERAGQLRESPAPSLNKLAVDLRNSANQGVALEDARSAVFNMRAARIEALFANVDQPILRDYVHVQNYVRSFNMLWFCIG